MNVAETILAQLGGNRFIVMTGARAFVGRKNGLSFKLGRNAKGVTHVSITLTPRDDYTVDFLASLRSKNKSKAFIEGVLAPDLAHVFSANTGLAVSL